MTLSVIDTDQQQTSGTSISRTLDSLAAGDLVVVFYEVQSSAATVDAPDGYVVAVDEILTGTTVGGIWAWPSNVTETSHVVTFAHDQAAVVQNIQVWQIRSDSGSFTSAVADKTNSAQATTASIQPGSTGTLSTASQVAIAAAMTPTNNGASEAIDSSFTIRGAATHNRCVAGELIVTADTALNPTLSWATSLAAAAMIATFAEPAEAEPVQGTVDIVLPTLDAEAAGTVTVSGTAALDLPSLDAEFTGTVTVSGAAAVALPALQVTAAGTITVSGSATVDLPALDLELSGAVEVTGTIDATLPSLDAEVVGAVEVAAVIDIDLPALAVSLEGTVREPVTGAIAVLLPALIVSLTGEVQFTPPTYPVAYQEPGFAVSTSDAGRVTHREPSFTISHQEG